MSKTQSIRDALAGGPLTFHHLHLKIGGDSKVLSNLCLYLRAKGEVKIGSDEDRTITLLSRRAPPQGRRAKSAGKGKLMKRPYKRIADKHARARPSSNGADLRSLAAENLIAAGALLRQTIEDGVEGLEQNFAIKHALDNQRRAEQLWQAAQA